MFVRSTPSANVRRTVEGRPAGRARIGMARQVRRCQVAVEDWRHVILKVDADRVLAAHRVVRIHARLMAGMRRGMHTNVASPTPSLQRPSLASPP